MAMSHSAIAAVDTSELTSSQASPPSRVLKLIATISGLLGCVLFIITPLLPINQVQSSFLWPQKQLHSVSAPLVSYAPESIDVRLPLQAVNDVRDGQNLILSTLPQDSPEAENRGLFIRTESGTITISSVQKILVRISPAEQAELGHSVLDISISEKGATVSAGNRELAHTDKDVRPQLAGIFSELNDNPTTARELKKAGLNVYVEINSRFTSTPTTLKFATMVLGLICTVISLVALALIDRSDGRGRLGIPAEWKKLRPLDGIVTAALGVWYIFGGNTSDDGYILTMARASTHSGYMANYYRWYGVPETPFGAPYYDLLGFMSTVSTESIWMRLPQLIAAILTWLFVSKSLLPRVGVGISQRRLAQWTAALVLLAFWTAYNNGLRPEPVIALGAVITWACFERAISTKRLLPAALGVIAATLSLAAGPTGLMAVATLLVSLSPLLKILVGRIPLMGGQRRWANAVPMLAPFLASGTAILVAVFADQSFASAMESVRVRGLVGPALDWYQEYVRYSGLLTNNMVDSSLARRFAVLLVLFALVVVGIHKIRRSGLPGTHPDVITRMLLIFAGTMFFMTFTPTKWTHHFGTWAGLGAVTAAVASTMLAYHAGRALSTRLLLIGAVMGILAVSLSGINGWWYVSSFGVPWWDKNPQFHGVDFATVALVICLIILGAGVLASFIESLRRPANGDATNTTVAAEAADVAVATGTKKNGSGYRPRALSWSARAVAAPLALACVLILCITYGSFIKGFLRQYPEYSIGLGNIRELTGTPGQLANDALIETNTNASFLQPADGSPLGESLRGEKGSFGFDANHIPVKFNVEDQTDWADSISDVEEGVTADVSIVGTKAGQPVGIEGGYRYAAGVNGSHAHLPFGIDPAKVPVTGSYHKKQQVPAKITTTWFNLPQTRSANAPLLVVSAAGAIEHHNVNGDHIKGQKLRVEYGRKNPHGGYEVLGSYEPIDAMDNDLWRNLRVPLADLPTDATVVRITAQDFSLYPGHWIAFTPPRVPTLESLNDYIPAGETGFLDWSVGLQFPQQRTFDHYAGVAEIPRYRISPDAVGKNELSPFEDYAGGGALGTAEILNVSYELPGYLKNNWARDWGSLQLYSLRTNSIGEAPVPATIDHQELTRSGMWKPSDMQLFRN